MWPHLREIDGLTGLDLWRILVVHSVIMMWYTHWWKAQARGAGSDDMETTDRKLLSWVEAKCATADPQERNN